MKRIQATLVIPFLLAASFTSPLAAAPDASQALRQLVAKYGCDKLKGWALSQPHRLFQAFAAETGSGSQAFLSSLEHLDKALSAIQAVEEALEGDSWKAVEIAGGTLTDVAIGLAGGPIGAALWTTAKRLNDIATAFTKFAVQQNLDTMANFMEQDEDLLGDGAVDHFLSAYLRIDHLDPLRATEFNLGKLRAMLTDYAQHELNQKDFPYFSEWSNQRNRVRAVAASYLASVTQIYTARRQLEQLRGELARVAAEIQEQRELRQSFEQLVEFVKGTACADHLDDAGSLCLRDLEQIDRAFLDSASRADQLNRSSVNALGIAYEQLVLVAAQIERLGLDRTLDRVDSWCRDAAEQVTRANDLIAMARGDVGQLDGSSKAAIQLAEEACTAGEQARAQSAAASARDLAEQAFRTANVVNGLWLGLQRTGPPPIPGAAWAQVSNRISEQVEEGRILLEELDSVTGERREILSRLASAEDLARSLTGKCGAALTPLVDSKLAQLQTVREVLIGLDLPSAEHRTRFVSTLERLDAEQLRLQARLDDSSACLSAAPDLESARKELAELEERARTAQTDLLRHAIRAEICARSITEPVPALTSFNGTWKTNWGTMDLRQGGLSVSGAYTHDKGKITGFVEGNVMTGTWSESPTYGPDHDAGDLELVLSEDGQSFSGRWRYGSKGGWSGSWNGTRVKR